jgi:predicted nucleic acid-binding protein
MKAFFDTSVLVPVFIAGHEHHERSIAAFSKATPGSACSAAHCLAEAYSTLTRLPEKYRASPEQAMGCVEAIVERLTVVTLDAREYLSAIRHAAGAGITGGTIYDAILAACATKAEAQILYTWNTRHFYLLEASLRSQVRTP